jgi:hypothetical protein
VRLDGLLADLERGRDIFVRSAERHVAEHLALARRQILENHLRTPLVEPLEKLFPRTA